jgi:hypothetical protein
MLRSLLVAALVALSTAAYAQQAGHGHMPGMAHDVPGPAADSEGPSEPGQAAFTAIQEIVAILVAEPATDWSRVDVEALRRHLIDMDNVTLRAEVATTPVPDGMRYTVSGTGAVRESIRRMVKAHAETMSGANGMTIRAEDAAQGAVMTVMLEDPAVLPKLKGLGFIGLMTLGMHHQQHHLMIATGHGPHR